jgi:hypothetical protein
VADQKSRGKDRDSVIRSLRQLEENAEVLVDSPADASKAYLERKKKVNILSIGVSATPNNGLYILTIFVRTHSNVILIFPRNTWIPCREQPDVGSNQPILELCHSQGQYEKFPMHIRMSQQITFLGLKYRVDSYQTAADESLQTSYPCLECLM